jgi:RHS repeat-associated protein
VSQSGSTKTLTYYSNGSLTNDGARALEWDGENHLIAVNQGTHRSEFTYNGLGQRARIVEKDNGAVTSDKRFVWCDEQLCQERDASGSTVTKAFYRHGLVDGGVSYFVTTDHLGNVREITNTAGVVQARYDYDPFGRMTKVSGSYDTTFGFAGYYHHAPTGLALPLHRAYAADLGRWTSEDPAGLVDGTNRYLYVRNNPANFVDPTGQWIWIVVIAAGVVAGVLTPSTANAPGIGKRRVDIMEERIRGAE